MRLIRFARLSMVLAGIFVLAALLNTALSTREEALEPPLLAGRLLIASPQMRDPRFAHAVILVVRHDRSGAMGIIINRVAEDPSLASLLEAGGGRGRGFGGRGRLFAGRPLR